jgi:hypothetical protein
VLKTQQRAWGFSRLEAARRMAQGRTEMHLSPEGKPEITSFYFQGAGLEGLAPELREQVLHYAEEAARTGQPMCGRIVLKSPARPANRWVPILLITVTFLGLTGLYCLGRLVGAT